MSQLFFTNVQSGVGNPKAHFGQEVFNPVFVGLEQGAFYQSGYYNISGWTTLGADSGAVTISGISQIWRHLRLVGLFRSTQGAVVDNMFIWLGGATSLYYNSFRWHNSAISTISGAGLSARIAANSAPANHFSPVILDIFNYQSTDVHPFLLRAYTHGSDTDANMTAVMSWGSARGAAAVSYLQLTCSSNIKSESMYALYGKDY